MFMATTVFGLEAVVAKELRDLGAKEVRAMDARVYFDGDWDTLCRACINLRCADRVFFVVGSFRVETFDELFEGVKSLPWEDYISARAGFPVNGKSARSKLFSVSDCRR